MVNCGSLGPVRKRVRPSLFFLALLVAGIALLRHDFSALEPAQGAIKAIPAQTAFGRLPLIFEPNQGQTDPQVKFLAHGLGYRLYLTQTKAILAGRGNGKLSALEMRLTGANDNAEIDSLEQLPGHSNYFIGRQASHWRTNIPQYSRVRYRGVYPGVDLDFYGKQGRLEYDFDVHPAGDFHQIQLDFRGARQLQIAPNGDLLVALDGEELRFQAPHIYQESSSGNEQVAGGFVLRANNSVGFKLGDYDHRRTLVIDPVLTFSSYFGGSGNESCTAITHAAAGFVPNCPAITVDAAGEVYIAGATDSAAGFPTASLGAPALFGPGGTSDIFVAKINSTGTGLDFLSFIGGSALNYPTGIGLSGFNVYIAGTTTSPDFPTTPTAFQATATGTHVFFTELNQTGSANLYSTYLAGSGTDMTSSLAVDSAGLAYLFGITDSSDFPVTPGSLQSTPGAANQFFFSKLNPVGTSGPNSLVYSTFIGGSAPTNGIVTGGAIALDTSTPPNVYIAGGTTFTDMPVLNAAINGTIDYATAPAKTPPASFSVWAAKLNAPAVNTNLYTPAFETYFGGSGDDIAYGVATDGSNTYVTGSTTSPNITAIVDTSPYQSTLGGGMDAFLVKFGLPVTTGTTTSTVPPLYFTYLGGSANDAGLSVVADTTTTSSGNARVTGFTNSANFPVTPSPVQSGFGGATDAFMARILTTTASTTTTSTGNTSAVTFLGGSGVDIGTSVTEDSSLNTYVTGETFSTNFPIAAAPGQTPLQASLNGPSDAFVSKLGPNVNGLLGFVCNASAPVSGAGCPTPTPANPSVNPSPVGVGNAITFTYSIFNQGDPVSGATFTDTIQGMSSTITSATVSGAAGGSCSVVTGGATALCNLGTINSSGVSTTSTTSNGTTTTTTVTSSAATVTLQVTANVPSSTGVIPPKPPDVGNIATLNVAGIAFTPQTASGSASVNDFGVTATPAASGSNTVQAGETAQYTVVVTPTGPIPSSISLACGTGLPSGSSCSFSNASIANLNSGPRSVTLDISTTIRVTTPAAMLQHGGPIYALWLPLSGLALLGSGVPRKRRLLLTIAFVFLLGAVILQGACSSSNSTPPTTTGTPAGTYNIPINATSGSATRSTVVQLIVQ
jgi:hypothetical protein